ncbi:hypothetical protein [Pontibacter harenae]|uniref:hypothetical protein n=1 Tax=Pontibacter harenae TaxID=2894083 RepID=UPI001E4A1B54|nr:hypothetical protein [Pontibacter harenae]MCC9168368.1 hypothetical protein [Pontibacter harenae]
MQLLLIFWLVLNMLFHTAEPVPVAPSAKAIATRDYCKVYGSVYLEYDPKYKNTAAYTVFLKEDEAFADMVVYREKNKLFADGTAIWYITPKKAFADHILYVTDNRNLANFTVHFTDVRSFATCREQ